MQVQRLDFDIATSASLVLLNPGNCCWRLLRRMAEAAGPVVVDAQDRMSTGFSELAFPCIPSSLSQGNT